VTAAYIVQGVIVLIVAGVVVAALAIR